MYVDINISALLYIFSDLQFRNLNSLSHIFEHLWLILESEQLSYFFLEHTGKKNTFFLDYFLFNLLFRRKNIEKCLKNCTGYLN